MCSKIIFHCVFSVFFFASILSGEIYEVLGIGAPCIDILFQVEEEFLDRIKAKKGACEHTDWKTFANTFEAIGTAPKYVPGGSCSNTIKGLCSLGEKVAICGKMGKDEVGKKYLEHVQSQGIVSKMIFTDTPTQQIEVFITPDHQRTFRVFPGAGVELTGTDLTPELFRNIKLVHIEGYAFHNGDLIEKSIELAKNAGATVSLDLANFEIVKKYKDRILNLLPKVDIVFANEEEALALTGLTPKASCEFLNGLCKIAVVLVGEKGCWAGSEKKVIYSAGLKVKAVDTTGAGDLFASGFLHGYLKGLPIEQCAYYGNLTGSSVVEVVGAEIPSYRWTELRNKMQTPPGIIEDPIALDR